ncbi:MAG: hypothetical protein RLZZ347_34 [Candidatus Parcubacteria bacterium]|jgi:hypothetical protein
MVKIIAVGTDCQFGMEDFVVKLTRKIPIHWQRIFPAWHVVIIDHSQTFRTVDSLWSVFKQGGFDARNYSAMADNADDWWSVRVALQPPNEKSIAWVVWIRHSEDRALLRFLFFVEVGAILWGSNAHLRTLWGFSALQHCGVKSENDSGQMFCEGFAHYMIDRRRSYMCNSPINHFLHDLDDKIRAGHLSLELPT